MCRGSHRGCHRHRPSEVRVLGVMARPDHGVLMVLPRPESSRRGLKDRLLMLLVVDVLLPEHGPCGPQVKAATPGLIHLRHGGPLQRGR